MENKLNHVLYNALLQNQIFQTSVVIYFIIPLYQWTQLGDLALFMLQRDGFISTQFKLQYKLSNCIKTNLLAYWIDKEIMSVTYYQSELAEDKEDDGIIELIPSFWFMITATNKVIR